MLYATPPRTEPTVNRRRENNSSGLRPNTCDRVMNTGYQTVEVKRKDVPAQKASIAFPLRTSDIVYTNAVGNVREVHAAIYLFPGLDATTG
ncbi:hypothetical protein SS1G_13791 [Sclerotinia sclerotiorum 1980 UF-70]|uniref:Uncharacterized protein n=1 Tax=Sclerotinia sclerotiorum (strain ATCC 18683 / 1980 / Ss-1) TaxID=665079 RepID=A7F861_SCLS1|nr:hypothetical protein SS1G_13791 [Sclerotinia sclerotiorum 1980 UF-70]EDN98932.1 hypothetical protein SS1G_13791 [Sclerotinia sclerotiorum 1980 UF-70]